MDREIHLTYFSTNLSVLREPLGLFTFCVSKFPVETASMLGIRLSSGRRERSEGEGKRMVEVREGEETPGREEGG